MSEERERRPNYNPADYAQLKVEAVAMDKTALEDDYVLNKDKKHTRCGDKIGIVIMVLVMLTFLIGMGYLAADDTLKEKVENNMKDISAEVCPILGEGYLSSEALHSNYDETRIICNTFNSNLE